MSKNTVKSTLTRKRQSRTSRRRGRSLAVLVVRFVSGRPLDGRRHSNNTFWTRGTRRVGVPAYLVTWRWWALASGCQRAAVRLAVTVIAVEVLVWVVGR